jgi:2-polyprenyl-6-methoxyphenol hydroxylase-like FAD-dependent oxidoreductase
MSPITAIIIGGGIGGFAAANALRQVGIDCEVFERAPAIQEVGAGLSLWSNAVRALQQLGLAEKVITLGSVFERAVTMTCRGKILSESPLAEMAREVGAPSLCVHRADLQRCLLEPLEPNRVQTASSCIGFEQDAQGITARFADGREARGDILIGADGLHSVVRTQLFGASEPRYAGYFAWRGIATFESEDLPPGQSLLALGRGIQVGLFRCGPGRVYWFATRNAPPGTTDPPIGRKREVLDALQGWPPPIVAAVEATDESAILRNDVLDRPPTGVWGEGRVTLLGDAIHPTTPNLGQGACQAIEDAVVLAASLQHANDPVAGLRAYETQRRDWTARVTRNSWSLGAMLQWQNPLAVLLRDSLLRTRLAQRQGTSLLRELLGHSLPVLPPLEPALNQPADH